ncbi:hypothetical protein AGABI2DRAFT_177539 [Agaricus bisporus var. bisporus H97]|uniref:hypothetical protein n=1 Tax=Agaricus bisporus var. bisporus (strain H97 / ATCC MYA-4626 / FGSC 10389) TaxID=936046 RepID=UPI00029F7054|nr:hypothetical protein AGABI2DRAFT_177539 [Agaricus bisporus var. bisporus H97]EKV49620.1 hypothetical protein AGABI2DRAFT_177539 [Agaricus bisporus var. bisporus H97]
MEYNHLPSTHFLAQPRPDPFQSHAAGIVDTTTLAAHDFDVDTRTGFMPPQPPLKRLPSAWEPWESSLDAAISQRLQLAEVVEKMELEQRFAETEKSRAWRSYVAQMPCLTIEGLKVSERALRRAHHVLAWLLHFYIHTISPSDPLVIPRPLSIPLLQVSAELQLPPVVTYSDDVLYNWDYKELRDDSKQDMLPTIDNIRCQTTFTGTKDEEEFYLSAARIELRGTEALELMRLTMDETFVGDEIAVRRITGYLERMAIVIQELRGLLLDMKKTIDPEFFYERLRPWFRGLDEDPWHKGRTWVFEGRDEVEGWTTMEEVSGASAGQSSLIQAFDIYLDIDVDSPPTSHMPHPSGKSFPERMRAYMPRHHRAFLNHLRANPRPLRAFVLNAVEEGCDAPILEAYNDALKAVKEFRDAHMIIVTLFIIGPARRSQKREAATLGNSTEKEIGGESTKEAKRMENAFKANEKENLKGTGGTDLVKFLKGLRDQTARGYLPQ